MVDACYLTNNPGTFSVSGLASLSLLPQPCPTTPLCLTPPPPSGDMEILLYFRCGTKTRRFKGGLELPQKRQMTILGSTGQSDWRTLFGENPMCKEPLPPVGGQTLLGGRGPPQGSCFNSSQHPQGIYFCASFGEEGFTRGANISNVFGPRLRSLQILHPGVFCCLDC